MGIEAVEVVGIGPGPAVAGLVWGALLESARFFKEARGASARPEEAPGGRAFKTREDAKKRTFFGSACFFCGALKTREDARKRGVASAALLEEWLLGMRVRMREAA